MQVDALGLLLIGLVAFLVSTLTLFTGFGLGTLLMPAFALFFPVEIAVAATAVVHVANNVFKLLLLRREVIGWVLLRFGIPAVGTAFLGALLLSYLSQQTPLFSWHLGGREAIVTPIKLVMGVLILGFSLLELVKSLTLPAVDLRWLPLGGAISGFFGGLSGHQGACRAAFLGPLRLSPAGFAATQAGIACMVDFSRLMVYGIAMWTGKMAGLSTTGQWGIVAFASLCAFGGALMGKRLLPKVTVEGLRLLVGVLLLIAGLGLVSGLI
jgi:uncharacterized membrane protein YfcA